MNNYTIAIKWAEQLATKTGQLVMSDQFFSPFDQRQRQSILAKLRKKNLCVFGYHKDGAIIAHKHNPKLTKTDIGGVWTHGSNNMMLMDYEVHHNATQF